MRSDKGRAFVLRREGKSYREISRQLGVAKSTLSLWFKGVDFSTAIREELTKKANKKGAIRLRELNRVRGIALDVQYEQAQKEAFKEMKLYRNVPLFTTALGIYWGAGDKVTKGTIRLSYSTAAMLRIWVTFLTELGGIQTEKMALVMYLSPDLDESKCRRYWSKQLGIKKFHKTQVLPKPHKTKCLQHGICQVVVVNAYLKKKLMVWIDQLPEIVLNTVPKKKKRGLG